MRWRLLSLLVKRVANSEWNDKSEISLGPSSPYNSIFAYYRELFYPSLSGERNPRMIPVLCKETRKGLRSNKWNFAVIWKKGTLHSLCWFKVLWAKSCSGPLQGHLFIVLHSRSWWTVDPFILLFVECPSALSCAHIYYKKWFSLRVICCLLL